MSRNSRISQELARSLRFLLVSLASATSNLLYTAALTHLTTLPFGLVSLTSAEFSMIVNFVLNDRFTFRNLASNRPWYVRLGRFQVAAIGGNLLTAALATFLHTVVQLSPLVAQTVAIGLTFFVNFVTHRFWTFRSASLPANAVMTGSEDGAAAASALDTVDPAPTGLSVIIPARNEQATIGALLLRLDAAMTAAHMPYEALVVDDYSSDRTAAVAASVIEERRLPARVLSRGGKPGKSYALMEGFAQAIYPTLAMIDADLELPPEALPAMTRALKDADIIVGRRLHYDRDNLLRGQLSAVFNQVVMRLFLGIRIQAQTGVKVFWTRVYESVDVAPGRWSFDMEFIAKALVKGYRVREFAIPFQKRQAGKGNVNPPAVALELLASALRIKLDIVRIGKTNTLTERATSAPMSGPFIAGLTSGMPGALEWIAPLALLGLSLHAVMGPAFFSSTQYFGAPGDTGQSIWYIGWIWHAILHGQMPFVTNAFDYPSTTSIMDYTSIPALGLFFGWLYPFAGVIFTYNLIIMTNYLLIFVFGKLSLRALGIGRLLSGVGGLLFCLLPYLTAQIGEHLNLAVIAPLLIAGYLMIRPICADRPPGWMDGALLGLAMTLVFYTNLETCATLLLCVVVVFACGLFCARTATYRLVRRMARPQALLGIIATSLLVIPGALNFFEGQHGSPLDFSSLPVTFSADLLSFVVPTELFQVRTSASIALTDQFTGNLREWDSYLSIPFILLMVILAARFWKDDRIRVLAHAAAIMALLSLGPFPHIAGAKALAPLPWLFVLLFHVPLLENALPTRLALYTGILALTLVMLGLDAFVKQATAAARPAGSRRRLGIGLAALAVVAIFWLPTIPSDHTPAARAVGILRAGSPASRMLVNQPTLVLNHEEAGFSTALGILAMSNNYALRTANVYGYKEANSAAFKVNIAFILDTDGHGTNAALRHYLPGMGVSRVLFISVDNEPLDPQRFDEISRYLGAPLYDNQRLVVIWNATPVATSAAAIPSLS
ncbi:MAG TPA: glycosyltransferase [Ktedonobacterales bacterium]